MNQQPQSIDQESKRFDLPDLNGRFPTLRDQYSDLEILTPEAKLEIVETRRDLVALAAKLEQLPLYSVDTETGGYAALKEPLNKRLAWIQIFIPKYNSEGGLDREASETYLVDVIALQREARNHYQSSSEKLNPLDPLKSSLENPEIEKIAHNKPFEEDQFRKFGIEMQGGVDTMTRARQMRPDMVSVALSSCAVEIMNRVLLKEEQTSDWLKRPPTDEQVIYMAGDPEFTMMLYLAQEQHLKPKVTINPERSLSEQLKDLRETLVRAPAMLREAGIAHDDAVLAGVAESAHEMLDKLLNIAYIRKEQNLSFGSSAGSAQIATRAQTRVDIDRLRKIHPEIAERVVTLAAGKGKLTELLKQKAKVDTTYIGDDIEADLQAIFPEVGRTAPSIKVNLNLDETYGQSHERQATVIASLDLESTGMDKDSIKELLARAKKLRPELPSHSLPACCFEFTGKRFDCITKDMTADQKAEVKLRNSEIVRGLQQEVSLIEEDIKGAFATEVLAALDQAEIDGAIEFSDELDIAGLVEYLVNTVRSAKTSQLLLRRSAGIHNDYAPCYARAGELHDAIKADLGAKLTVSQTSLNFETDFGSVRVSNRAVTELDLDELQVRHPDLAEYLVYETTTQDKLRAEWEAKGVPRRAQELFIDRLWLEYDRTNPSTRVFPKYKYLYEGQSGNGSSLDYDFEEEPSQ